MTQPNKKYPVAFFVALVFSSCATILNGPVQKVFITPGRNIKVISVDKVTAVDSTEIGIDAPTAYYIVRSKNPLKVNIQIDSIKKTILLKQKNSFAYWFNIYCNYGIGMLADKDNAKRYAYTARNYLTVKDTSIKIFRFAPIKKGTINLSLSVPFTTIFNIKSITNQYKSAGFFGLETGLDYFFIDNHYLSVNMGAATDRFGEYLGKGYFETGSVLFTSVRNNNIVGSFDLGYGLNFSQLKWSKQTIGDTTKIEQSVINKGFGLSLSAQYRLGNYFRLGVLYEPGILNTSSKPVFGYQHYISFNLTWKLSLRKTP
ncbi:MAG: hypothetical protein ABIN97_12745 [Ginsengibacter sp.]